jgi:thioredoxin reductase
MFCFGYEQRGSRTAGLLTTGQLAHAGHAITNAQDANKFAETVTIFTNGNAELAEQLSGKLVGGLRLDKRPLKRLFKEPGSEVIQVEFDDGEVQSFSFLVSKPDLEIDSSLPDQLGVECVPNLGIKVAPPFNKTNVEGVYAAGDCCSPLRMVPNALNMGAFAGCGLARELPRPAPSKPTGFQGPSGMAESIVVHS